MTPETLPRHLYVHVPFCARRCSYCDFSIAVRSRVPVDEYIASIRGELDLRFTATASPWILDTLYFGGGTPSRLGGDGVRRLLDDLRRTVALAPGAEVTLEANPDDVTAEAVAAWHEAGVTRLSIGAQSFDDGVLAWMHRTHDAQGIGRAADAARAGGLEHFSLDLIFALPEHLSRDWERDVDRALDLGPSHLSLYGLTVEPRTPLGRSHARGEVREAPEEKYEREFLHAHAAAGAAGLEHYEVSNFGRPGHRAVHNSAYWSGAAYAGVGPSAHGFDGGTRRWNVEAFAEWSNVVSEGRDPVGGTELLTDDNRCAEAVYLGLRTTGGLVIGDDELSRVQPWIDAGWATLNAGNRLVLTALGWLRLDALSTALTVVRSH